VKRRFGSFYERRVFPWINDKLAGNADIEACRAEVLATAAGRVVEIGFGTGLNLRHYPDGVERVVGLEPNPGMLGRFQTAARDPRVSVRLVIGEGERLPFSERSFDTAVSVLTLCSVSNPQGVLSEIRRVLRDDGKLVMIEHGLSADAGVAKWQHRLNPLQNLVACGCNLNRPTRSLVESRGFRFERVRSFYLPGAPRPMAWLTLGVAVKAETA
jgi:ubiquinone/menaquinone biosynthesis C-methylase UbiE